MQSGNHHHSLDEDKPVKEEHKVIAVVHYSFLWWTWLSGALPLPVDLMIIVSAVVLGANIGTTGTIIDGVYWIILFFFKELNQMECQQHGDTFVRDCTCTFWCEPIHVYHATTLGTSYRKVVCNSLCHSTKRSII